MSELDQAKVTLYRKLLSINTPALTDIDVELMALLAKDPAIQRILNAAVKKK